MGWSMVQDYLYFSNLSVLFNFMEFEMEIFFTMVLATQKMKYTVVGGGEVVKKCLTYFKLRVCSDSEDTNLS